jgi:hypothetical protein
VSRYSRRSFFALIAMAPALSWVDLRRFAQVVSIHGDLPYLDRSGAARPYRPASGGHRSVAEITLRGRHGFL